VDAPSATGGSATVRQDAAAVAWWVLVGAASGAIAGALVGGIGGRLAMLLLRLTSPDAVTGMISDDGFEIGVDVDQLLEGGARYRDKRPMAKKMWDTIMRALEVVKAVPRQAVA